MHVTIKYYNNLQILNLKFHHNKNDKTYFYTLENKQITVANKSCFFNLPTSFNLNNLHPDRLAFAIILCYMPFIHSTLELPFAVSESFANIIKNTLGIIITNISKDIMNNKINENKSNIPGLCLSMGIDSMAGLLLMPKNTKCIFLDRHIDKNTKTTYKKDCVYNGLAYVRNKLNHQVIAVPTDMEFLRFTPTFMLDISVTVPALLLSNHCNLKSINVGYSIHHFEYYQNPKSTYCTGEDIQFDYNKWSHLFQSVGLYLNFPTMGLSEIGTLKVVLNSPFSKISTGCMSGRIGKPCLNCKKCYRKVMLTMYLKTGNMMANKKVYNKLAQFKWHKMHHILDLDSVRMAFVYMTANYKGKDPFIRAVKERLNKYKPFLKYLDQWFVGSKHCMDTELYKSIIEKLGKYKLKQLK